MLLPDSSFLVFAGLSAVVGVEEHPPDDARGGVEWPKFELYCSVVFNCLLYFHHLCRDFPVFSQHLEHQNNRIIIIALGTDSVNSYLFPVI